MFSINSIATKILSYVSALVIGFSAGYSYCNDRWKTKDYEAVVTSQKVEIQKLTDLNAHNENIVVTQNKKIQQGNHLARELQNEISKKDHNLRDCSYTNDQLRIIRDSSKGDHLQDASSPNGANGESATVANNGRVYSCSDGIKLLIEHDRICHMYMNRVTSWENWYTVSKVIVESQ
jgi:hypothetical protein